MDVDGQFINTFNEHYPFERYIFKEPKPIGNLFDDLIVTELFIPNTEIKPILDNNDNFMRWTAISHNEIYIKVKTKDSCEFRLGYFDFDDYIRENIRINFYVDFGKYEWECLYVDYEDLDDLKELLKLQKKLITEKYGICNIKKSAYDETVRNLIE